MNAQEKTIRIGDASYTVRFSIKAMIALQDHYGLDNIDDVGKRLSDPKNIKAEDFAVLLWAGLRGNHPDVTFEDALDLADKAGLGVIRELGEVFSAAQPKAEPQGQGKAKRRPR